MGKEKIIQWVIALILERVASDDVKKWLDAGLDLLEDKVDESSTKVDDIIAIPVINLLREALSIPDND